MNKYSLLQDDQKEALKLIKKFIQSNNKDIFILEGSLNSGKSFMISYIEALIKQLIPFESKIMVISSRIAKQLETVSENVTSIYSHIYGGEEEVIEENDESAKETNEDEFLTVIPVKNLKEPESLIYIVDDAQLISDNFHESIDILFGSGYLLKDFLEFSGFPNLKRKIIFLGDSSQISFGSTYNNALNDKYLRENYSLRTVKFTLIDKPNYSMITQEALKCVKAIREELYYKLFINENAQVKNINKIEFSNLIQQFISMEKGHIICYSNREAQKFNMWIKKNILVNGQDIASGDKVILNNTIIVPTVEESPPYELERKYVYNGTFAKVIKVDKEYFVSEEMKIKDDIVVLKFKRVYVKFENSNEVIRVLSFENFRLNEKATLSKNEVILYNKLLRLEIIKYKEKYPFIESEILKNLQSLSTYKELYLNNKDFADKVILEKNRKKIKDLSDEESKIRLIIREAKKEYDKEVRKSLFEDTSSRYFQLKNAAFLRFGWAMTVHKARMYKWNEVIFNTFQGSNGRTNSSYFRWLYTGFGRAIDKLYLLNFSSLGPFDKINIIEDITEKPEKGIFFVYEFENKDDLRNQLKYFVTEKLKNTKINLKNVTSYDWQEKYSLEDDRGNTTIISFYFNSRGQVKEPSLISGDNTISNEIIEYLIKKNNDFDFSIIKDEWRKEQYIELSKKLEKEGIYFEYLIQFNFKDKIKFFYSNNDFFIIELDYNNSHEFTRMVVKAYSNKSILDIFIEKLTK